MKYVLEQGSEADFPAVLGLIRELAIFEKQPDAVTNTVAQMEQEKELFDFYVARTAYGVVGFSLYYFTYSTWVGKSLYLEDLYVKEGIMDKN